MSWVAVGVTVAGAAVGAYSSNQQAKAANKSKTSTTNQTTTQSPYLAGQIRPDLDALLAMQRGLVAQGPAYIGGSGTMPTYGAPIPGSGAVTPPARVPNGQAAQAMSEDDARRAWRQQRRSAGGAVTGNSKAVTGGPTPAPGPNLSTPQGIAEEVARRGLQAGSGPEMDAARRASLAVLGGAGTGEGDGTGTGFGGYNPISDRLAQRLEGEANGYDATDLLHRFLDQQSFGGGPNGGGGGGGAGGGGNGYVSRAQYDQWTGRGGNQNNGGGIGDATGTGTFGTQVNKIFSDQVNQADLQAVIDAMSADAERGHYATIRDLDSAAQGGGRFGGGSYRADRTEAQRGLDQELIRGSAATRLSAADQIRQAKLQALGLVNTRDLGALDARTSAEIAASNAASSRAGAADQLALARRGQDLDALGMLLGNQNQGNATLAGLGQQLSSDRMNTMGQVIPGLQGVGLSGLDRALGGAGAINDANQIKASRDVGMAGVRMQGNALNQQAQVYNATAAQNQLFDYLKTIQGIGGMGGESYTYGQNVQPGLGVSVGGSTLGGAAAGAAQGYGLYLQGRR